MPAAMLCGGPAGATGPIRIGGTGQALAAMAQVGAAFQRQDPGLAVQVLPSLGSGGGIAAVKAGTIDLALSARPLRDAEQAAGLRSHAYAITPVAFASHASTRAAGVSRVQIARILSGDLTTWPDGTRLRLIRREPTEADWVTYAELGSDVAAAIPQAQQRPGLTTVISDQENADLLERTTGSFAMIAVGQALAEQRRLRLLSLDNQAPDLAGLLAGRYTLHRTLRVVWTERAPPAAMAFLDFLRGDVAAALLRDLGHARPADAA